MIEKQLSELARTNPKARPLIDFLLLGMFWGSLSLLDAPPWTFVLLVYTATRASRLDLSIDMAALQSTTRQHLDYIDQATRKLRDDVWKKLSGPR